MTVLRWYDVDLLQEAARLLRQRVESSAMSWLEFAAAAAQYLLRDEHSQYWFVDCAGEEWYSFSEQSWRLAQPPRGRLEGLESLAESSVLPISQPGDLDDPFTGKEAWQPTEVMEILTQRAGQDYRAGRYSSSEVELLLGRLFLLDRQGRFWTIGMHSEKWYRYAEQGWVQVGHRPDPNQLVRWRSGRVTCAQCGAISEDASLCPSCGSFLLTGLDHLDQAALLRVHRFLLLGAGTLPEPVAAPWEPPAQIPSQAGAGPRCAVCSAPSLPGSRFCHRCGALLGAESQ